MLTKISKILFTAVCVMLAYSTTATAADKTITLLSDSSSTIDVVKGSTFTVQVIVDDASIIAGASFTVNYNTTNVTLDGISSSFFGTFASQGIDTPETGGYVTVDSVNYYSPQVVSTSTGGSMIAAARFDNGTGENAVLFTLTFNATGNPGDYSISVNQSVIINVDAGYTANPNHTDNLIPFFVGIEGGTYPTHTVSTINALAVTITIKDEDSDGIDDNWEISKRLDSVAYDATDVLNYYTATGDYDGDGYSDYQEYLNDQNDETDPVGTLFDPSEENASGGIGYIAIRFTLPAVNMLLLNN